LAQKNTGEAGGSWWPDGTPSADPSLSHGTKVAGVVAEIGDNIEGAAGVGFSTKILSLKIYPVIEILDDYEYDKAMLEAVIEATDYAASLSQLDIINISFGTNKVISSDFESAINDAWNSGKIIVAAVGNNGTDIEQSYPASYNNVVGVAACEKDGKKADYSNYGIEVDICAYGTNIFSTTRPDKYDPDMYDTGTGTSFSTPEVAGSIALLLSYHPNLTNQEAVDIITQNTKPLSDPLWLQGKLGGGLVDPYLAMISKAPLLKTPKFAEKYIFNDAKFEWYPYPGTSPTKYYIDAYKDNVGSGIRPPILPQDGSGLDLGTATSFTLTAKSIDFLQDGNWFWRVGAKFTGDPKVYWSNPRMYIKQAKAKLIQPIYTPGIWADVQPGYDFQWEQVDGAKNYVVRFYYGDNKSGEHLELSMNSTETHHKLTEAEYYALPAQSIAWAVTGASQITSDKEYLSKLWYGVGSEQPAYYDPFRVPILKLWKDDFYFTKAIDVEKEKEVTIINSTNSSQKIKFTGYGPSCPKIPDAVISPNGGMWKYKFNIPCDYTFFNSGGFFPPHYEINVK
jgi:hypothetical protein